MMVGRDLGSFYKHDHVAKAGRGRGEPMLTVEGVTDGGRRVKPASFTLYAGEVLGLAGLVGSGRTELARLIYGADPKTGGTIKVDGKPVDIRNPMDGLNAGITYLTEDRKHQGLFLDMSVRDNVNFSAIVRDAFKAGVLNRRKAADRAKSSISDLKIRVASPTVGVGTLSGGNQQKVLLARWLEINPRVMILDEPTRGVDIGAKAEIYRIIDQLAQKGVAVLVISSELPEIMGICDRILVMREGHIEGEVGGTSGIPVTQESIMALATGVQMNAA
jgi:ribose transport system ATP-binding protein